jgi:hypothetical protein
MQARIQSWFPFSIQVCLDGREWLARAMDRAGIGYVQRDNCFAWLEDAGPAQRLMDRQVQAAWPELLEGIARSLNPMHDAMFEAFPVEYYWSTFQSEWANDILFRAAAALARLYPRLVHHGLMTLSSPDAMRFPGRHIPPSGRRPPALQADVVSDIKTRPEGVRIKHRLAGKAIKMYDEQGSVLRVETTIDEAAQFKSFRAPEGKPEASKTWQRMRKGIADLNRRAAVSQAANDRICGLWLRWRTPRRRVSRPPGCAGPPSATAVGFARSILTPYAPADAKLLEAISRGDSALNGLRNRDLRRLLFADSAASKHEQRRQAAAVSRKLALLRAHRRIRKVPRTRRYHLSDDGRTIVTALLTARNASTDVLTKLAA